jgi:hypothetical protein
VARGFADDILLFVEPEQGPDAAGGHAEQGKMQRTGIQPLAEGIDVGHGIISLLDNGFRY